MKDTLFAEEVLLTLAVPAASYDKAIVFLRDKTAGRADIREARCVFSAE